MSNKYNLGDKVFLVEEKNVFDYKIINSTRVEKVGSEGFDISVNYILERKQKIGLLGSEVVEKNVSEGEVYNTKEDAIAFIDELEAAKKLVQENNNSIENIYMMQGEVSRYFQLTIAE